MFSYARNSCYRNHWRYTLCGAHHAEGHKSADWQTCKECRNGTETEMYVYYGTNEYNFVKLANPPTFQPTHCAICRRRINLGTEGFTFVAGNYQCTECYESPLPAFAPSRVGQASKVNQLSQAKVAAKKAKKAQKSARRKNRK